MNVGDLLRPFTTWKFWSDLIVMTLAMLFSAFALNFFLIPGNLVLGSTAGLAMVLSDLGGVFGVTIKVSTLVLVLNAFLLLLAWVTLGKEFGAKTIYTSLIIGPLMDLLDKVLPASKFIAEGSTSVMGDIWFDLLCFVGIISVAQTILFRINASSGGLDIIAKILNKYANIDIGEAVTVSGVVICLTAFAVNPFRLVVIGIIGTWINGLAVDHFTTMLNRRKRICIISDDYEMIRSYIINDLRRGCTLYEVRGGFGGETHTEIQSLLTKDEFAHVLNFIKVNKLHSFVTAGNVSEVYGLWNNARKNKAENIE